MNFASGIQPKREKVLRLLGERAIFTGDETEPLEPLLQGDGIESQGTGRPLLIQVVLLEAVVEKRPLERLHGFGKGCIGSGYQLRFEAEGSTGCGRFSRLPPLP